MNTIADTAIMDIVESIFAEKFLIDDRPAAITVDLGTYQLDFFAPKYAFFLQVILVSLFVPPPF